MKAGIIMPKEYIEREALIEKCKNIAETDWNKKAGPVSWSDAYLQFIDDIEEQPTADMVEVKHGEWRDKDWSGIAIKGYMACSQCNVMIPRCELASTRYCLNYLYFCPNCGAKMDGKDK